MKKLNYTILAFVLSATVSTSALLNRAAFARSGMEVVKSPKQVKWGPAPAQLRPGSQLAVLAGDPAKAGVYTLRLKMPAGYWVSPHWHPADVNVTVISGTFGIAMGDRFEKSKGQMVKSGGFFREPKEMHHYAWADGPTVIQLHGEGPFVINYVNPADDPSTKH